MADTHQTLLEEIDRLRVAERREMGAVREKNAPVFFELMRRCGEIGHAFAVGHSPFSSRTCVVCKATENVPFAPLALFPPCSEDGA